MIYPLILTTQPQCCILYNRSMTYHSSSAVKQYNLPNLSFFKLRSLYMSRCYLMYTFNLSLLITITFVSSMNSCLLLCLIALIFAQNTYDPILSHKLAYFSAIAYDSIEQIVGWKCQKCSLYPSQHVKAYLDDDLQGFTAFNSASNAIILAFRGSVNIDNWINNIMINPVQYPLCDKCKVHNGFYRAYKQIQADLLKQVEQLTSIYSSANIFVSGHSLGGAIAILATAQLKQIYGSRVSVCVTFGQPRVGNAQFADYMTGLMKIYRVVHYADPVPHVPKLSYKHGNTQIWYDQNMVNYQQCQKGSNGCSKNIRAVDYNINDHSIDTYIKIKQSKQPDQWYMSAWQNVVGEFSSFKRWFGFGSRRLTVNNQQ